MAAPAMVGAALFLGGAAVKVVGALKQGDAESQAALHRAATDEHNAKVVQQQAEATALMHKENTKRIIGQTTAAYGASGISGDSGTALDVLSNSAQVAERDRQTILYKGRMNAMGYETDAQLERQTADNARSQSYKKAGGMVIEAASKAYDMWGSDEDGPRSASKMLTSLS